MSDIQFKIIVAGSVGSGKTTSIAAISDIEPFKTEEVATDETGKMKSHTTVAMDYGQMRLEDDTVIHLYGTPGQGRFDFMWDIVGLGALGVMILINNNSEDPIGQLDNYITTFYSKIKTHCIVVGVTCTDLCSTPDLSAYREHVKKYDENIPVYTLDARNGDMVRMLARTLLYRLDPLIN